MGAGAAVQPLICRERGTAGCRSKASGLFLFALWAWPPLAVAQDPVDASSVVYDSLLARLVAGDTAIDYRALRIAYTTTPDYDPVMEPFNPWRDRMRAASRDGDVSAVRAAAESLLTKNYVDIDPHVIAAGASRALGDSARNAFHGAVARGLLKSIVVPGAGQSLEHPFEVIAITEEYALLATSQLQREEQALMKCSSGVCDMLKVVDPATGAKHVFYFDVSRMREAFLRRAPREELESPTSPVTNDEASPD